jgi:hypothetical protein
MSSVRQDSKEDVRNSMAISATIRTSFKQINTPETIKEIAEYI